MRETGSFSWLKKSLEPGGCDERIRQAEVVGCGEAADRAGGGEPRRVGGGFVPSRGSDAEPVLPVEEAIARGGGEDLRREERSSECGGDEDGGGCGSVQ